MSPAGSMGSGAPRRHTSLTARVAWSAASRARGTGQPPRPGTCSKRWSKNKRRRVVPSDARRRHYQRFPPPPPGLLPPPPGRPPPPPNPPRPPPPPPGPRRGPPPPPPDPAGFAISTLICRPSRSLPFNRWTAAVASSGVAISTKPKPRDRPENWSVMTVADVTLPHWVKNSRRPSLVVENERLPMKSFCAMGRLRLPPVGIHVAGRGSGPRRGLRCAGSRLNRRSNQTAEVYHRRTRPRFTLGASPLDWPARWRAGLALQRS